MLESLGTLFKFELILLLRRSQEWIYPIAFFVIIIILFPLAFTADNLFLQTIFPGSVWLAILLAILLSVENIFFQDLEDGCLEQLILSQIPLSLLIGIKLFAQWCVSALPIIIVTPLLGLLFHLSKIAIAALCLSLVIGTPILIMLSSLGVALTLGLRQSGIMLGLLILPLSIPLLVFGVTIVKQVQAGFSIQGPVAFLAGIAILVSILLPSVIGATLKISLDD